MPRAAGLEGASAAASSSASGSALQHKRGRPYENGIWLEDATRGAHRGEAEQNKGAYSASDGSASCSSSSSSSGTRAGPLSDRSSFCTHDVCKTTAHASMELKRLQERDPSQTTQHRRSKLPQFGSWGHKTAAFQFEDFETGGPGLGKRSREDHRFGALEFDLPHAALGDVLANHHLAKQNQSTRVIESNSCVNDVAGADGYQEPPAQRERRQPSHALSRQIHGSTHGL